MPSKEKEGKKGVSNVTRQTWDKAHYERLAQQRAGGQVQTDSEPTKEIKSNKEEFKAADEGSAGPMGSSRAFLKSRSQKVSLDNDVGKVRVLNVDDPTKSGGYFCEVCEVTLKDSVAYLDHINGKRHLSKLGYSMRVERSTADQVKNRLQSAIKRKWDPVMTKKLGALEEHEKKVKESEEREARVKRQKKEKKKAAKEGGNDQDAKAEEVTETPEEAEMKAMMGFSGFNTSKK